MIIDKDIPSLRSARHGVRAQGSVFPVSANPIQGTRRTFSPHCSFTARFPAPRLLWVSETTAEGEAWEATAYLPASGVPLAYTSAMCPSLTSLCDPLPLAVPYQPYTVENAAHLVARR
jgi:hypothetical protein